MTYQSAGCAFQALAGRTLLQAGSVRSPSQCTICTYTNGKRRSKGPGKCQAVVGRHSLSHGAPGSHSCIKLQQSHQQWRYLLSLAAAPSLKAAAESASSISDLYISGSCGGSGGDSGNGSGPWGNGDGSSGMFTTSCVRCAWSLLPCQGHFCSLSTCASLPQSVSQKPLDLMMCRFQRWS